MLKWVAKQVGVTPLPLQIEEAAEFTEKLSRVGDIEMGNIADMVAEYRFAFEKRGIEVSAPLDYIQKKPAIITRLEEFLKDLEKNNDQVRMAAIMVWLHTMRAALAEVKRPNPKFMGIVKQMWAELSRGFSDISGDNDYPQGFDPGA